MAFDFGERRIGVAIGNTLTGGARPLAVIEEPIRDHRFQKIQALLEEWAPDRQHDGQPRKLDTQQQDQLAPTQLEQPALSRWQ